jgi:hypothetical protein
VDQDPTFTVTAAEGMDEDDSEEEEESSEWDQCLIWSCPSAFPLFVFSKLTRVL